MYTIKPSCWFLNLFMNLMQHQLLSVLSAVLRYICAHSDFLNAHRSIFLQAEYKGQLSTWWHPWTLLFSFKGLFVAFVSSSSPLWMEARAPGPHSALCCFSGCLKEMNRAFLYDYSETLVFYLLVLLTSLWLYEISHQHTLSHRNKQRKTKSQERPQRGRPFPLFWHKICQLKAAIIKSNFSEKKL